MTSTDKELAKLRKEVAELKAALTPSPFPTDAEVARHRNEQHQLAERRASGFNAFTRDQLRAMNDACPNPQAIVHDQRNAPIGPASVIPRQPTTGNVRAPVNTTGWQNQAPIGPPAGINYVDAQLDAQDRRDRAERVQREAAVQRAMKAKGG